MNTINNISGVGYISEEIKKTEQNIKQSDQQSISPSQPLPGSALSENELWRILSEAAKILANGLSGTAKENSDAKKMLIGTLKDAQIAHLNERMKQLESQEASQKKKSIWGKIAMALAFVAAIVMAPFNPAMSAIMIGTMVAALVVPKVVDKILEAAGVAENIRQYVKIAVSIMIAIAGTVLSFNPGHVLTTMSNAVASTAAKAASQVQRAMDSIKSVRAFSSIASKVQEVANKVMKILQPLITKLQQLAKGDALAVAKIGQYTSVASNVSSMVTTGYGINLARITRDSDISVARQDELDARFEQLQILLNTAMRAMNHAFESLFSIKDAEREFNQKMLAIHL